MFCQKCGTQIADGSAFCASCGAAQTTVQQSAAPVEAQAPVENQAPVAPQPTTQGGFDFTEFMYSKQYHNILVKFGLFIPAALFVLFGILLFTGCQYGGVSFMGYSVSYSTALYESNAFILILDILFGIVCLAGGLAQVFFWAQFANNNLGFLPMLEKAQAFKLFNLVNLVLPVASAAYFLINGICVSATSNGMLSFFAPWIGLVMLLLSGAFFFFNKMYYKNHPDLFN